MSLMKVLSLNDSKKFQRLKGRKRAVNIKLIQELRIVKRDIRRRYIDIYNHVMNIHDCNLLSRFLNDICTPSCSFITELPAGFTSPPVRKGLQQILLHTIESQMKIPDGVQWLGDGKIHVSLGRPGTRITSSISFRGTLLYKFSLEMELEELEEILLPGSTSSNNASSMNEADHFELPAVEDKTVMNVRSNLFHPFPLLPRKYPREVTSFGVLTMFLDDANRIECFHVKMYDFNEKDEISSKIEL